MRLVRWLRTPGNSYRCCGRHRSLVRAITFPLSRWRVTDRTTINTVNGLTDAPRTGKTMGSPREGTPGSVWEPRASPTLNPRSLRKEPRETFVPRSEPV